MTANTDADEFVVVGRFGAPYGVKGWIHLTSYTSPPANLATYWPWQLAGGSVTPTKVKPHRDGFVAHLPGIEDRDAAAAFRGQEIRVAVSTLPAAEPGEYYWRDLMGLQISQVGVGVVGSVVNLLETGAHDVLCVQLANEPESEEVLIPFVDKFVQDVDFDKKLILVDWPELEQGS